MKRKSLKWNHAIKWLHSYDAEEVRYDYWTTIRSTPLGEIFVMISLTPKSTKSYVQEVVVWIGNGDYPVYQTKKKISGDVTRTIREIKGLQKNVLCLVSNRLADASKMIDDIVFPFSGDF